MTYEELKTSLIKLLDDYLAKFDGSDSLPVRRGKVSWELKLDLKHKLHHPDIGDVEVSLTYTPTGFGYLNFTSVNFNASRCFASLPELRHTELSRHSCRVLNSTGLNLRLPFDVEMGHEATVAATPNLLQRVFLHICGRWYRATGRYPLQFVWKDLAKVKDIAP